MNPETAVKLLQKHITKIEKWLQEKQIKANPNKCNHITFTLRKKIPPSILLNGTNITQTKHVKYLGFHLDTQLTWELHTKSIIEKIQKTRRQMHNKPKIQIKHRK